jgi:hypothetical protein
MRLHFLYGERLKPDTFGMPIPAVVFCRSMKTIPSPEWNVKMLLLTRAKVEKLREMFVRSCQGGMGGVWKIIRFLQGAEDSITPPPACHTDSYNILLEFI